MILYPSDWDRSDAHQNVVDSAMDTSLQLLRMAAERFDVSLVPLAPIFDSGWCSSFKYLFASNILMASIESIEMSYPMAGLFSLTNFDRLLYLPPSGMILNSLELDALFKMKSNSSALTIQASAAEDSLNPCGVLLKPSTKLYQESVSAMDMDSYSEQRFFRSLHTASNGKDWYNTHTIVETAALHFLEDQTDSTEFQAKTAYVHFTDPGIRGPEYDLSKEVFLQSKPSKPRLVEIWEDLYQSYKTRRMDICGLELESLVDSTSVVSQ